MLSLGEEGESWACDVNTLKILDEIKALTSYHDITQGAKMRPISLPQSVTVHTVTVPRDFLDLQLAVTERSVTGRFPQAIRVRSHDVIIHEDP
jgi:hypothetical protein